MPIRALRASLTSVVLPAWVKRCGERCGETYNRLVAPITGMPLRADAERAAWRLPTPAIAVVDHRACGPVIAGTAEALRHGRDGRDKPGRGNC